MANLIKLKRSAVAAKVPLTTDLEFGELAMNTDDGALYMKKKTGASPEEIIRIGYVENFTDLQDTPTAYTGWESATIRVNDTPDGVEFVFVGGNLGEAILTTTPTDNPSYGDFYEATVAGDYTLFTPPVGGIIGADVGDALKWDGTEWINAGSGGGATTFTQLTDTPTTYSGKSGQFVVVKPSEDGLDFVANSSLTPIGGYTMIAQATAPTADGEASFDTLALTTATTLTLFANNNSGIDQYSQLLSLKTGDKVTLERVTPTNDIILTLTADAADSAGNILLTFTIDSYTATPVVVGEVYNVTLEFAGASFPTTFLELTDTPSVYTGQAGKVAAVNSTEDALEFVAGSSGVPEAPTDGVQYGRQNANWTPITGGGTGGGSTLGGTYTSTADQVQEIIGAFYPPEFNVNSNNPSAKPRVSVPAGSYYMSSYFTSTTTSPQITVYQTGTDTILHSHTTTLTNIYSMHVTLNLPAGGDVVAPNGGASVQKYFFVQKLDDAIFPFITGGIYSGFTADTTGSNRRIFAVSSAADYHYTGTYAFWSSGINENDTTGTFLTNSFSDIKDMVANGNSSMIVTNAGVLWVTGLNSNGQLGTGNTTTVEGWTENTLITSVDAIRGGNQSFSMVLKSDGTVWNCGVNTDGQLGIGNTTSPQTSFVQSNIVNGQSVWANNYNCRNSFVIDTSDDLYATGENNYRQLGLGTTSTTDSYTLSNSNVAQVANMRESTVILKTDGTLWSVGRNSKGECGLNSTTQVNNWTQITVNATNIIKIVAGDGRWWALKSDGTLWACGDNTNKALGVTGSTINRQVLAQCSITAFVDDVVGGARYGCFPKDSIGYIYLLEYNTALFNPIY